MRRTVTSSRPASLPNRLAPHLLVLWALCGFAAPLAHSQVSEALVSNIAETTRASSTGQFSDHRAQRFETGNNPTGYTVTGVDLDLNVDAGADTPVYTVEIWSGSAGSPGSSLGSLSPPTSIGTGVNSFTTPGIDLDDLESHFVVVNVATPGGKYIWRGTSSNNETSSHGWQISDSSLVGFGASSWLSDAAEVKKLRINGLFRPNFTFEVTLDEDTSHAFAAADFTDDDTLEGTGVRIVTLPGRGSLTLDGANVTANQLVSKTAIAEGKLKYTPAQNGNGNVYASLTFKVNDGTSDGTDTFTMIINVTPVNDAATGTPTISGMARAGARLTASTGDIGDTEGVPSTFTFQWVRVGSDGSSNPTNVGANSITYTLADADVGMKIKVRVSFTDDDNHSEGPLESDAYPAGTDTIAEAPPPEVCRNPDHTGGSNQRWTRTMTIGNSGSVYGFREGEGGFGELGENSQRQLNFGIDDGQIRITAVTLSSGTLTFGLNRELPTRLRTQMALHVCDRTFPVSADSATTATWTNTGFDWSGTSTRTLYVSRDAQVPSVSSATVNGATLEITFDENLGATVPPSSAFTVERTPSGGAEETISASGTPAISGTTLTLTLAEPIVYGDTNVKVNYSQPSNNRLTDRRSNAAASFSAAPVTNNTPLIPMLSIAVDKTNIAEDAGVATVTLSTLLPFSTDQTIDLTLAGTADENIDYIVSATSLTLTTGQTSVSATVTASNDNYDDDAETVIVTATSGDDDIGAVTVTIDDDDAAATLSVSVNNPSISEAGGISTLTVSTGGTSFATDQTIDLMLAGTATMTDDYIISDTSLTLPANATSISATVTAVQNTIEEPNETVLITASHNGAPIGTQQTVTITDDEARPPMLSEAKVNGNRMTLVFDEDLNPDATPALGAFAVRVAGRSVTVQALSRTSRPSDIILLLASAAVQYDPASVSYTVPNHVPNRLQDSSGYHVAAITAHRVENTTPATPTPTPTPQGHPATGEPAISGVAAVGRTLTASSGTIADADGIQNAVFVYKWVRVDGANETTIDGAEGPTYTVAVEDIGKRLKVRAEFTDDDGYDEGRTSAATAVIPDTVVPELRSGGAEVDGVTLKLQYDEALNGNSRPAASAFAVTVGGQPATLTGVAIDGDTVTLTLSSAVAKGDAVTVGYTRPAANPVEDLAGNDAGNLSGVTVVNKTSAPPGIPENLSAIPTNDSLVFAWSMPQDGGSAAIEGYDYRFALGGSVPPDTSWVTLSVEYFLPVATLRRGTEYAFEVRARNLYGRGPAAALTATTTGSTDYPATGAPTISGTVAVRSTLTASTAGIDDTNGVSGATYGFEWFQVDGGSATAIDPETNSSYKVRLADIGKTLKARVSFTDDGGGTESVTSAETAVVPHADNAPPTSRDASLVLSEDGPTYAFKPSDFPFSDEDTGHQLEGILVETPPSAGAMYLNSGRVSSGDDVPLENIEHHSLTYRPDPNHHGTPYGVFTFRVFDGTHHSADAYSFTIDVTAQQDDPTGAPSISGTAKVGETLTADISGIGDVDGLQGAEFAYQWVHVDDGGLGGATETDITGATDAAYTLGDGDLGKRIKVKVSFTDDGGSMHSLPSDVFPQTGSVKAANTPPTAAGGAVTIDEDTPHTFAVADFNFSDADPGDTLASVTIVSLPAAGSLTLAPAGDDAGVAVTENQSVAVADIGRLRFTPAANGHGTGYASFDFKVNDGEDDSAQSYTMTVNVTAMNDPPTSAGAAVTIDEDTAHTFDAAEFSFDDADAGDTLASVMIVSLPAAGSLRLAPAGGGAGVAVTENQSVAVADIGRLRFTPAANGHGTGYASFDFKVNDGEDDSAQSYTMTVNVTAVNDPPTAEDRTHAMSENEVIVFTAFRFRYDDIDGDPLASVTILTVPAAGSLTLDTGNAEDPPVAVSANQVIGGTDLAAGRLKYTPRHNASGSPYASFGFRVNDGTADSPSYTFTINVTDVNEPPTAADSRVTAREDTTYNFRADDFNFSDPDGDALHSVRIISVGGFGGEIRKRPTGTIRPPVTVSAADIDAGNLIFVPDTNEQGSRVKSFRFTVADGSGVSAEYTMTIDVEPVNDPPNSSDKTVTTREDSHHAFTVADFPFSDPDDGDQLESVKILSLPTAGSLAVDAANPDDPPVAVTENQAITRAQLDAGALKFTPEENESGARYATFAFKVTDGEADSPRSRTMTISVLAVNDPPTSASNRLSANEDEVYRFSLADFSYHDLEEQPLHSVGVLALPERGALWLSGVQLTQGRRVLSADIGRGEFRFSPAANANGAGYASFTFKVSDGQGDSAETYTMTFDVAARNDPPQGLPVIVGQAVVNSTVTADTIDITDMDGLVGVAFTYQWIRVGVDGQGNPTETEIGTATMSSYAVTDDDAGSFLKVKVTFTDNGGTTASLTSQEVFAEVDNYAPVGTDQSVFIDEDQNHVFAISDFGFYDQDDGDALSSVRIVTLPGKGRLMLDADPPRAVVAQQSVSAADIDAGKLRFEPAPNENGDAYTSFTFKVSDGRAEAEQANTFAFGVFRVDDPATGNPVIIGTAQVGETLTVDTSAIKDADGLRNVEFEYQWIQVDGGNETEISGADGISYQLVALDVGKRLKVKVGFSDDEFSYEDLFSAPTDVVQTAGALTLNLDDAIAGDNAINIAEKAAGFSIGGDTGTEIGVEVTVGIGTGTLATTSADDAGTATWSVSVLADAWYITGTSVDVTVNASKAGYSAPAAITRSLTVDLTAPTAPSYSAPASLKVREAISAISPSVGIGIDRYSATGLPSGLSIDGTSGVISGTPDTADANTATATVTVSDAAGNSATATITFPAVDKGDQALSGFQYSASSVPFGSAAPSVTAPSGVRTSLGYSATPAEVCTVHPSTGALTLLGAGICEITATAASSANYNSAIASFTVTVQTAGALVLNLRAIAGDNRINIAEKAAGFSIGGDTGTEIGVDVTVRIGTGTLAATSADNAGTATWSVSVPVNASYITGTSVVIEVNASKTGYGAPVAVRRSLAVDLTAPTAPTYTAPASLKVGVAISAMNPSGGVGINRYSATDLPSGLTLDTSSGVISGTPDTVDANTTSATVTVSDTAGNSATVPITFPAVDKGDQALSGFEYSASSVTYGSAAPTVTAPTGVLTTLGYTATPASVCTVDPSSGALTLVGAGICVITATAAGSDRYNSAIATFRVTVQTLGTLLLSLDAIAGDNRINIAEKAAGFTIGGDTGSVGGANVTVTVGTTELTAPSADANPTTWSVSVPADASYITGTSVDVEVNASKIGYSAPAPITRTLTVDLSGPTAPTYSAPATLKVGEAISAISPLGGVGIDEYSATGLPLGLTLDTSSGVINGSPDTADANTASVTVTVSDAAGNTATVDITLPAVDRGDQALSGFEYSASSVTYGSAAPAVTAPTGVLTTLGYTAAPAEVCAVDPSSGALTLLNAGICVITATAAGSANHNSAIASFTVTVQAAGALVLNLDVIAGDNAVNIAEKAAGFSIGGDTGTEIGVEVTVGIGTGTLASTSADAAGTATWSVSVPADASYITGTSVDVTVNASKIGYGAPAAVTRTLTVDLSGPTAPSYSAPSSLKVGQAISAIESLGRRRHRRVQRHGPAVGVDPRHEQRRNYRHAGHRRCEHRDCDGDRERRRGQLGHGDDHVSGGGQGRPGAERVPVQRVVGSVRVRGPQRHRTIRRAHFPRVFRDARRGLHGAPVHGRAYPAGRGHLRDHRRGGFLGQPQLGNRQLHGDGAARRRAGAEPRRHRR